MATPATRNAPWTKLAFILAVVGLFAWRALPLREKITFGLDLQGGSYMVLRVELDEAIRSATEARRAGIEKKLRDSGVAFTSAAQVALGQIEISGLDASSADALKTVTDEYASTFDMSGSPPVVRLSMRSQADADIRDNAARQVRDTIGRRINEFGVGEPLLQSSGDRGERLVLQLPGLDDVERVKGIITRASVMEFRLGKGATAPSREAVVANLGGTVPPEVEILQTHPSGNQPPAWVAVDRAPVARGEDLLDARAGSDRFGKPSIHFILTPSAGEQFGTFTSQHKGEPLAIVLDGNVVQYANIRDQIFSNGEISGNFTQAQAQDAALTLRSGALPAKVTILEERTVGPSLGKDSVDSGFKAALAGFLAVMVFLLLWYKGAGVNAAIALGMNVLIVLGMLSVIGATLTLPGIAGLILTLVSAVDANVIIFERIKEEIVAGKSPAAAVDAGFDKAFSAIIDSNVTTLIASFFLYNFGTGPIKGFGVTLALGILASMFTAIYVSRALFELVLWLRPNLKSLSIMWRPPKAPHIGFMRYALPACAISAIAVLASVFLWLGRGLDYGIDFEGGTQVVVQARPGVTADDLRQHLAGTEFNDVTIQGFGREGEDKFLLRILGETGAAMAEETRDVNRGAAGGGTQNAASRLTALLSGDTSGRTDLNSIGTQALADLLVGAAGLGPDEASAAARTITDARTARGGLLPSEAPLDGLDIPAGARSWLQANATAADYAVISSESVGPAIGSELRGKALTAILLSLLAILAYATLRFQLNFGMGAIVALAHDVIVAVGVLALLHYEFDINVIAALLTLAGYSLNDTIVIFDRVRENQEKEPGTLSHLLDMSVSQCLSRTFLTAGTSLFAIVSILLFGGPVLEGFALALTMGMLAGTYSTVFVASPVALLWERTRSARAGAREAAATR